MSRVENYDENAPLSATASDLLYSQPPMMLTVLSTLQGSHWLATYALNLLHRSTVARFKATLNLEKVALVTSLVEKMSIQNLMSEDEKGDTRLTCLLRSMAQFGKMKDYLIPLVERIKNIPGVLEKRNKEGKDILLLAAINLRQVPHVFGYLAGVMLLEGIDINKVYDNFGNTLIHLIVNHGDLYHSVLTEILMLFKMSTTSDMSRRNGFDETALHLAVKLHHSAPRYIETLAMTYLLLEAGADLKARTKPNDDTALHLAVSLQCNPKFVKVLLQFADPTIVNMQNSKGNTPLHLAVQVPETVAIKNQLEVCQLLIKAGALTDVRNRKGRKPIHLASLERKSNIKKIFMTMM